MRPARRCRSIGDLLASGRGGSLIGSGIKDDQRFFSVHSMIYGHFRPRRHLRTAGEYWRARTKAFRIWRQETCAQAAFRACRTFGRATDLAFLSDSLPVPDNTGPCPEGLFRRR
jgi:hypothetical protein